MFVVVEDIPLKNREKMIKTKSKKGMKKKKHQTEAETKLNLLHEL
jgi:hypothetical protein